jgi:hypothetical protein
MRHMGLGLDPHRHTASPEIPKLRESCGFLPV